MRIIYPVRNIYLPDEKYLSTRREIFIYPVRNWYSYRKGNNRAIVRNITMMRGGALHA